jgi:N-acetyl-anhydromuramyl-L-alanine amidase AmpD
MPYDPKCGDLARSFLEDEVPEPSEDQVAALAQLIQDTIETFLQFDPIMGHQDILKKCDHAEGRAWTNVGDGKKICGLCRLTAPREEGE